MCCCGCLAVVVKSRKTSVSSRRGSNDKKDSGKAESPGKSVQMLSSTPGYVRMLPSVPLLTPEIMFTLWEEFLQQSHWAHNRLSVEMAFCCLSVV